MASQKNISLVFGFCKANMKVALSQIKLSQRYCISTTNLLAKRTTVLWISVGPRLMSWKPG